MPSKHSSSQNSFLHEQYDYILAKPTKFPALRVGTSMEITSKVDANGFVVKINNHQIRIRYPKTIWNRFPKSHKNVLAQNITYSMTFHVPYLFLTLRKIFYKMPVPLAEAYLFKAFSLALPSTAIMQSEKKLRRTSNLLRKLFDIEYIFLSIKTSIPPFTRKSFKDQAIMPFTFGKDSLLTFAVARELGIHVHPVFVAEPYSPYEQVIKASLSRAFRREFHTRLAFFNNTLGVLRDPDGWFGWELQLTQYTLMLLPYVYAKKAAYIFFSNEQSCNNTMIDEDGFKCNPVFEQSHSWLLQNSLMASIIGGNSLSIGSLLEPLHDLAIMKILHRRYKDIAKYQSSCDVPDKPKNQGRWCEHCSKCARMYIMLLANGINPKRVGFLHNMLSAKYQSLYTIFANAKTREFGYDQSGLGNDEQIYAFYLAYQRGIRGPVMNAFVRHYLQYARKNERRMRKVFFGIHSTKTIPISIKQKVLKIYRQELADLS